MQGRTESGYANASAGKKKFSGNIPLFLDKKLADAEPIKLGLQENKEDQLTLECRDTRTVLQKEGLLGSFLTKSLQG